MSLHPYFITGFSVAESCFMINLLRPDNLKFGWQIQLQIGLHQKKEHLSEPRLSEILFLKSTI